MWFLGVVRSIFAFIDWVAFGLVDQAYNLIDEFSKASFFNGEVITQVRNNLYVIIGIFALFRIALLLVNAMINPDKLNEKGNGIGNVLVNLVIMFALLIATPILFNEALDLQEKIVEGNYVQKIFLDTGSLEKLDNPGKMMQSIAISSLITLNDEIDDCSDSECQDAVDAYEEMRKKGFTMTEIMPHIDSVGKANGEKVFVYDYMVLVTTVAGIFITHTLIKFALDIGIRMVKLTALQILAPMFIVTYIDPKSAKSGPFNNWLKEVGKTYVSLFTRLAIVAIMLLLLSLIDNVDLSGGIPKLLLLLAVLVFAKEAPKWIAGLIGVSDEGLGDGILKKLGGAALVGGAITKGANALGGAAGGLASGVHNQLRNRRARRKEIRDEKGLNSGIGKKARQARKDYYEQNNLSNSSYAKKWAAMKKARSDAYKDVNAGWNKEGWKEGAKQLGAAAGAGALLGGKAGIKADSLKGSFTGGINASNQFGKDVAMSGSSIREKIAESTESAENALRGAFGRPSEIQARKSAIEDAKNFGSFFSSDFKRNNAIENTPLGQKDFNAAFSGARGGSDAMFAAMALKANPEFSNAKISTDGNGQIIVKSDNNTATINGETGNITYSNPIAGPNGTQVNGTTVSDIASSGKALFSAEGLANYENMFAKLQEQAINSLISNNTQMGSLMQQKSGAEQSRAYNLSEAVNLIKSAGWAPNGSISINGTDIDLSQATIDDLKKVVNSKSKSGLSPDEASKLDSLQQKIESYSKMGDAIKNLEEQIGYYQASNAKLKNTVDEFRKDNEATDKTLEELLVIAEKKAKKKQEAVDSYKALKTDDKK